MGVPQVALILQESEPVGIDDFTMDFFSLKGKTAIVTGGNSGLGLVFSTTLAKAGANLFIPSFIMDDGEAKQLIERQQVAVEFLEIDITEKGAPIGFVINAGMAVNAFDF